MAEKKMDPNESTFIAMNPQNNTASSSTSATSPDETEDVIIPNDEDFEYEDPDFENCELDDNGWGDEEELVFDEQKSVEKREFEEREEIRHRKEVRRLAERRLKAFWKCGRCEFLNHPSRTDCMMCHVDRIEGSIAVHLEMPQMKDDPSTSPSPPPEDVGSLYEHIYRKVQNWWNDPKIWVLDKPKELDT